MSLTLRRVLMETLVESQFGCCPLGWIGRTVNRKINYLHETSIRLVYKDYTNSFEDLFSQDNSVTVHHRDI